MSLVENLISQISSTASGGITKPQGFNLDDDTFAKLLEKAVNANDTPQNNLVGEMGIPAGLQIEPFDEQNTLPETEKIIPTEEIEIKDLKVSENYFSSLINDNSDVMNLAKRHAANAYSILGKGFIENLEEFAGDAASLIK